MAVGRTTESRSVTITTGLTSTTITGPAGTFAEEDAGRAIAAPGLPAGTTITAVGSDTSATVSQAATAAATVTATIGTTGVQAAQTYGFTGWSPETDTESEAHSVAAVNAGTNAASRITNPFTPVSQRSRG